MASDQIDPAGETPVIFHTGDKVVSGVPARDLTGGDLARVAYVRAHAATDWDARDDDGNPTATAPKLATPKQLEKLAEELVATGAYRKTKPADDAAPSSSSRGRGGRFATKTKPDDAPAVPTTTSEPAAPAEG